MTTKANKVFGYLLLGIVSPFLMLGGIMCLFSYPDDNKSKYPWNIVPLRLFTQGLLLPLLVITVPVMLLTWPIWYGLGELIEECLYIDV